MSSQKAGLPAQSRYITTHDADGRSIFSNAIEDAAIYEEITPEVDFFLAYANTTFPAKLSEDLDLGVYKEMLNESQPPLSICGGTVLRVCNFAPSTPMHRTISLDFGIVASGEVELVLDSGETRLLRTGDIDVQRGTMHAWRTPSKTEWSRMVFILQEAEQFSVGGETLQDDYGGIPL